VLGILLIVDLIWVTSAGLTEVNLVTITIVILNQYFSLNPRSEFICVDG